MTTFISNDTPIGQATNRYGAVISLIQTPTPPTTSYIPQTMHTFFVQGTPLSIHNNSQQAHHHIKATNNIHEPTSKQNKTIGDAIQKIM
jgi:hypothetical protein